MTHIWVRNSGRHGILDRSRNFVGRVEPQQKLQPGPTLGKRFLDRIGDLTVSDIDKATNGIRVAVNHAGGDFEYVHKETLS